MKLVVFLGDTYASICRVCGKRGDIGLASERGPNSCQEAVKAGEVYCDLHLPEANKLAEIETLNTLFSRTHKIAENNNFLIFKNSLLTIIYSKATQSI